MLLFEWHYREGGKAERFGGEFMRRDQLLLLLLVV